jgi:hypothetical protein
VSATAERLFDDYWFVLARTGRARGPGGIDPERLAAPAVRRTLLNAVRRKPQVMVKITSFARSKEGLAAHLDYRGTCKTPHRSGFLLNSAGNNRAAALAGVKIWFADQTNRAGQ